MRTATKELLVMATLILSMGPIFNATIIKEFAAAKKREAIKIARTSQVNVNRAPAVVPKPMLKNNVENYLNNL